MWSHLLRHVVQSWVWRKLHLSIPLNKRAPPPKSYSSFDHIFDTYHRFEDLTRYNITYLLIFFRGNR